MQEIISRTGEDHCLSCGLPLDGDPRFCPSCGTRVLPRQPSELKAAEPRGHGHPSAVSAPSPTRRKRPWGLLGLLIAAGLAVVVLAGWLFWVNGRFADTKAALSDERSRVTKLDDKVASLKAQVDDLTTEKSDLQNTNSSLQSAMVDCKDAAAKTRRVLKMAFRAYQGTASAADVRSAARVAQSSWSVCQTEAATNGSF